MSELVTVEQFLHRDEAELARARLAASGIRALVQSDDEGGLSPGFFTDFRVRLVVNESDLTEATAVLAERTP